MVSQAGSKVLIISDLVSFAVNKLGRIAQKPLKSVLLNVYNVEDISATKELLLSAAEIVLTDKWSKSARRRKDSINRSPTEIDDMLFMLSLIEVPSRLITYVSSEPDKMPSVKLMDGDLAVLLQEFSKIKDKQAVMQAKLCSMNVNYANMLSSETQSSKLGRPVQFSNFTSLKRTASTPVILCRVTARPSAILRCPL